jgi:hypothetical protein
MERDSSREFMLESGKIEMPFDRDDCNGEERNEATFPAGKGFRTHMQTEPCRKNRAMLVGKTPWPLLSPGLKWDAPNAIMPKQI